MVFPNERQSDFGKTCVDLSSMWCSLNIICPSLKKVWAPLTQTDMNFDKLNIRRLMEKKKKVLWKSWITGMALMLWNALKIQTLLQTPDNSVKQMFYLSETKINGTQYFIEVKETRSPPCFISALFPFHHILSVLSHYLNTFLRLVHQTSNRQK